ncbi:MAG: beta strand repeat-containing protein [Pirellulales bacterium]
MNAASGTALRTLPTALTRAIGLAMICGSAWLWCGPPAYGQLYWNTNGVSGTLTAANWGTSAAGPFTTPWSNASDVVFTAGSSIAYVTNTPVGNLSITNSSTVAWTGTGTFSTGAAIRTVDIGPGSVLLWNGQQVSSGSGTGFIKNGDGTWSIGTMFSGAAPAGFTLNAGRIITSNNNGYGNGPLTINGGTWEATGNVSMNATSVTLGGDFTMEGTGNITIASGTTISLGAATRTLTNKVGGANNVRALRGVISGAADAGLTIGGTGNTFLGNAANTFSGPLTVTGGEVFFNDGGALGVGASIVLDGGQITSGSVATGAAPAIAGLTNASISPAKTVSVTASPGNAISVHSGTGVLTFNGVIADKTGATGSWSKAGGGRLVLGGASVYSGSTAITNGTLQLALGTDRLPASTLVALGQASGTNTGTLDLDGNSQRIAGLVSVTGSSATATKNTVTSTSAATLTLNVTGGTCTYGSTSAATSGVITGAVRLVKAGSGTQVLGGVNTYNGSTRVEGGRLVATNAGAFGTGGITVTAGTLDLGSLPIGNAVTISGGSLINAGGFTGPTTITGTVPLPNMPNSAVTVAAGGVLSGSPTVATIAGAGLVSPGNSPGIVSTTTLDPSGGLDFAFEFTGTAPNYATPSSSTNDVVRLTATVSPFTSSLTAANAIDVYLDVNTILVGDTFQGGFFTPLPARDLLTAVQDAAFHFYAKAAGGPVAFNGATYAPLDGFTGITGASVTTVDVVANFGSGDVAGSTLQFIAVPEPPTVTLVAAGLLVAASAGSRRRRR